MKNFLSTAGLSRAKFERLLDAADAFKAGRRSRRPLEGRSVGLVFLNPSLRTRASMQVAVFELGGNAVVLEPGTGSWAIEFSDGVVMDGDKAEHVKEFVGVLEQYVSVIAVRCFPQMKDFGVDRTDPILSAIAKAATVPVVNLESAMWHPCQALADMMTIRERLGNGKKKVLLSWAWHPRSLPMAVPNSFAMAAAQMGHDLTIAHPPGYELDEELIQDLQDRAASEGGSVEFSNDPSEACEGAEVIYAKSWGSNRFYGNTEAESAAKAGFRGTWTIDADKMARTANGIFLHCLPVRRNVIVSDEVIDSAASAVIQQAGNRLHTAKAVLSELELL